MVAWLLLATASRGAPTDPTQPPDPDPAPAPADAAPADAAPADAAPGGSSGGPTQEAGAPWSVDRFEAFDAGKAHAIAAGVLAGAPVLAAVGADGLWVVDLTTGARTVSLPDLRATDVRLGDLGDGPQVLACTADGVRGITVDPASGPIDRVLIEAPCGSLAVTEAGSGIGALFAAHGTRVTRSALVDGAFTSSLLGPGAGAEPALTVSGVGVAYVGPDGVARRGDNGSPLSHAPDGGPAPVVALAGVSPGPGAQPRFAVLQGRWQPRLVVDGDPVFAGDGRILDGAASGLVSRGADVWVLDRFGARLGRVGPRGVEWTDTPVPIERAAALDVDADGCTDLAAVDATGRGLVVYGRCAPIPDRVVVPPTAEPGPAPATYTLGSAPILVRARIGETVRTTILHPADTGLSSTGPDGLTVDRFGVLTFTPVAGQEGRYWVQISAKGDHVQVQGGFALWVIAANAPDDAVPPRRERPVDAKPTPRAPPPPIVRGPPPPNRGRGCTVGLGIAAGAAKAGGTAWENLGQARVRGGASPAALMSCAFGGESAQLFAGADTAPMFTYGDQPDDRRHLLAFHAGVQGSVGDLIVGVFATYGVSSRGAGVRLVWTPMTLTRVTSGPELRAIWLAPQYGLEGVLAWVVRM